MQTSDVEVQIRHYGPHQVSIVSRDREVARQAAERYMEEHQDRSWSMDPIAQGCHGGAYVSAVGFWLVGEPLRPALSQEAVVAIATAFLDGLEDRYALGCVLQYGIAFTTSGDELRETYCEKEYRRIVQEIDRIGRERY